MSTLGWLFVAVAFALVVAAINNSWQAIYDKIRSLGAANAKPVAQEPTDPAPSDPAPLAPLPPSRDA